MTKSKMFDTTADATGSDEQEKCPSLPESVGQNKFGFYDPDHAAPGGYDLPPSIGVTNVTADAVAKERERVAEENEKQEKAKAKEDDKPKLDDKPLFEKADDKVEPSLPPAKPSEPDLPPLDKPGKPKADPKPLTPLKAGK